MESCRLINDCVNCVNLGCVWTSATKFACRSSPDETDEWVFPSCEMLMTSEKPMDLVPTDEATALVEILILIMGSVGLIFLVLFVGLHHLKISHNNGKPFHWPWTNYEVKESLLGLEMYESPCHLSEQENYPKNFRLEI